MGDETALAKMAKSLPELNQTFQDYLRLIEDNGGELSDEMGVKLAETELALARKVDRCDYVLQRLAAEAAFYEARAAEVMEYAKACKNARERLLERVTNVARETPGGLLEGETIAFRLTNATPAVVVTGEDLVPSVYKKTVVSVQIDKMRLKEDLKAGLDVPGAHLKTTQYVKRVRPKK